MEVRAELGRRLIKAKLSLVLPACMIRSHSENFYNVQAQGQTIPEPQKSILYISLHPPVFFVITDSLARESRCYHRPNLGSYELRLLTTLTNVHGVPTYFVLSGLCTQWL